MPTDDLTIFTSAQFGQLRVFPNDAEPWFVARDVTDSLDLDRTAIRRLDDDEKGVRLTHTLGGKQEVAYVTFPGLLSLTFSSRKPEAREYKRWVTHEVLPAIHQTGGYLAARADDSPEDILALALKVADATIKRREERIQLLESERRELMPKASFYDAVADSDDTILIGELAKLMRQNGIGIGQNRLFAWMRENGYLGKYGSHRNIPTQYAMDMELFRIKESTIPRSDGSSMIKRTPRVTGKGQAYFLKKLKEEWL